MCELNIDRVVPLRDGAQIPQLGFGVYELTDAQECNTAIQTALDAGYRHFDTATAYGNEGLLGSVFADSDIPREELFLTTKCWISDFGKAETRAALEKSLGKLKTDYVDLYLLHWPKDETMMPAWEALIELQAEGKIKSIGVSNFSVARFENFFFKHTEVVPAINQIESHPLRAQADVQSYCEGKQIVLEAYSPLARANIFENPTLKALAEECGKTPAQVILRWHLQQGRVVIPKSSNPSRIRENCDLYDFSLTADQLKRVDGLDENRSVSSWRPNDGIGWY